MADKFKLKIITPDRLFYEGEAEMVEFNTTEGEVGVYAAHVPMTVIVAPGVLTITEADGKKDAALHSGFAEILPEQITIMAETIEWPAEIDRKRAEDAKARAEERINTKAPDTDIERAEVALRRAIARLNIAK